MNFDQQEPLDELLSSWATPRKLAPACAVVMRLAILETQPNAEAYGASWWIALIDRGLEPVRMNSSRSDTFWKAWTSNQQRRMSATASWNNLIPE